MRIEFDQIAALIVFIVCGLLLFLGIDGEVKTTMGMAAAWIIGSGYQARRKGKGSK